MTLPGGRVGSLLALGLTGVMLAVLGLGVVAPLRDWHADRAENLAGKQAALRRMHALADSLPHLARVAAGGPSTAAPVLLAGATDAVAAAALQGSVQELAAAADVPLASVETLASEPRGAYRRIALRLSTVASWPAIVNLLFALDRASPRILVDDLQLRVTAARDAGSVPMIDASLVVLSFRAGTEGKP